MSLPKSIVVLILACLIALAIYINDPGMVWPSLALAALGLAPLALNLTGIYPRRR